MEEARMLRRLKAGKTDALDALIEQYNGYVCTIIRTVLGAQGTLEDVEELASDVFLAIWNHADALWSGKVKADIGATARNRARSFLRSLGPMEMDLDELPLASPETPEGDALNREQQQLLRAAVDAMGEPDREIFLRYYYYYQTTTEIAALLGRTPENIRLRLCRGRERLKTYLQKEGIV